MNELVKSCEFWCCGRDGVEVPRYGGNATGEWKARGLFCFCNLSVRVELQVEGVSSLFRAKNNETRTEALQFSCFMTSIPLSDINHSTTQTLPENLDEFILSNSLSLSLLLLSLR
jgi:hypothetical protein